MTDKTEPKFTCQICGRSIKANTGIIAHHGYKRPDRGSGWQTASCAGARHKPYEISCDCLPPTILYIKEHIERVETKLEDHINNPPKTLIVQVGGYYRKTEKEVTLPPTFDAKNPPCCVGMYSYEGEHSDIRRKYERDIKYSKQDLQYMEKRLDDWIPPKID
jgi:hypothetical protein